MKFKTPKTEQITDVALMGASAVAGAALSNVSVAKIIGKDLQDDEKAKKRKIVKGVAVVAGLAGLAFVDGNDTSANAVRGALLGVTAAQGISLAKEFIDKTSAGETIKQAVGLASPVVEYRQPTWILPSYNNAYETEASIEVSYARNPLVGLPEVAQQSYN